MRMGEICNQTKHAVLSIRFNWKGGSAECKGSRTAQIAAGDQNQTPQLKWKVTFFSVIIFY